jgi:hypothetical protein
MIYLEKLKEPYWEAIMIEKVELPVKIERNQVESYIMEE